MRFVLAFGLVLAASPVFAQSDADVVMKEAKHLANIRQVTSGFPRAGEGYFSPDGKEIVYQAYPLGYPFYQIYVQKLDDGQPQRISPGRGRTTCAYFSPDGERILFASAHTRPGLDVTEKAARDLAAQGGRRRYEWDFDEHMDIYTVDRDGTNLRRLTDAPGYDAEGSYSADGEHIVFTSTRDGDPDLYIMDADGANVRQLTNVDGYDGGPFFSPDKKWVIFRSDREEKDMLQIYAVSFDGRKTVQLTHNLNHVNWCPYFHPSGKYIIWSGADYTPLIEAARRRESDSGTPGRSTERRRPPKVPFQLFTMEIEYDDTTFEGGDVTQVTFAESADVLPVFSPDGKKLMWTSTRTGNGTSQLWIAEWVREAGESEAQSSKSAADPKSN